MSDNDNQISLTGIFLEAGGRVIDLSQISVDQFYDVTDALHGLTILANGGDEGAKRYLTILSEIDGRTDRLRIEPSALDEASKFSEVITPVKFSSLQWENLKLVDGLLVNRDERFFVNQEKIADIAVSLLKNIGQAGVIREDAPAQCRQHYRPCA